MRRRYEQMFGTLYNKALEGDADCGGLFPTATFRRAYDGFEEGRPLFVRSPESKFTLANFMRTNLYTALVLCKSEWISLSGARCKDRYSSRPWRTLQDKRCRTEDSCRCDQCTGICYGDSRRGRSLGNRTSGFLYGKQRRMRLWKIT